MKAKKIVYLMLIMVVLISGCNHQNNNMEECIQEIQMYLEREMDEG